MKWLNLEISTLRSPEFIGSNPAERAAWLCVLGYCVEQENGGRMKGAAHWKDRQWQQACGVTLKEVKAASKLLAFDDDDLLVSFYPITKENDVQKMRALGQVRSPRKIEAARGNGSLGGRPKNNPTETQREPGKEPNEEPNEEEPTETQQEPIEGKGKERKREREEEPTRAPFSEDSQNNKRRDFIESMGAKTWKGQEDLLPEWVAVCKGLNSIDISTIFKAAKPGILWPSDFRAHRAARSSY